MTWNSVEYGEQWKALKVRRRQFIEAANRDWLPKMSVGAANRNYIANIGAVTSHILNQIILAETSILEIEAIAQQDLGDSTFDLAGSLAAAKIALQDVTSEVKTLWDAAGGQVHDMNRDSVTGLITFSDIPVSAAPTTNLRNLITIAIASLS